MILGIDASNLRGGGGVTHLIELLRAADPGSHGFSKVILWGGGETIRQVEERPWLEMASCPLLEKPLPYRAFWQRFRLSGLARSAQCDVLFVPGGSYAGDFRPIVTMSRNMLPFEWREAIRYGLAWRTLKLALLRVTQVRSYRRTDGLIFLTNYAKATVSRITGDLSARCATIPHGIDHRFLAQPHPQRPLAEYTVENPFRLLYVSIVDVYKHQWNVAIAVATLRREGFPVILELVGPSYAPALTRLKRTLKRIDPDGEVVHYFGPVSHRELPAHYSNADLCVFASSCENMPNILLEGMASGLPVACSKRGPMTEVLGEGGVYFDPEQPADIVRALRELMMSPAKRFELASISFDKVSGIHGYDVPMIHWHFWPKLAIDTIEWRNIIGIVAQISKRNMSGPLGNEQTP